MTNCTCCGALVNSVEIPQCTADPHAVPLGTMHILYLPTEQDTMLLLDAQLIHQAIPGYAPVEHSVFTTTQQNALTKQCDTVESEAHSRCDAASHLHKGGA